MGVYFFNTNTLRKALNIDTANLDFGKHVIPTLKDAKAVYAYPFYELNKIPGYRDNKDSIGMLVKEEIERTPDSSYWSDVGDPYILWAVHMDLVRRVPLFDLYNTKWPIHSKRTINPPFKIDVDAYNNEGQLSRSIAGAGTIISGGKVISSVVFQRVFVDGAGIEESIVMDDVYIGRDSKWGNPFYIKKDRNGCEIEGSREDVIKSYEQWIRKQKYLIDSLHELKDKKLGCFCYPLPCHGDVLIYLVK